MSAIIVETVEKSVEISPGSAKRKCTARFLYLLCLTNVTKHVTNLVATVYRVIS